MHVIDLDRPVAVPPARRRRTQLYVAAALVIGAIIGASTMYGLITRRQAAIQEARVAVFAFAQVDPLADDLPVDRVVSDGRVATVTLTRRITLVNAGPVPIIIRTFSASRPGVSVHGVDKQRSIEPGASLPADAEVRVDCVHGLPLGRLPVTFLVQTYDGEDRRFSPRDGLDGTPWNEQAEVACAANA